MNFVKTFLIGCLGLLVLCLCLAHQAGMLLTWVDDPNAIDITYVAATTDIVLADTTTDFVIDANTELIWITDEDATVTPDGIYYDSNNTIVIDSNTLDPNSLSTEYGTIDRNDWTIISVWPPKPTHKCLVHGVIDYVNQSGLTIDVNGVCITRVCIRCLSDLVNNNLPQLELIERNEGL